VAAPASLFAPSSPMPPEDDRVLEPVFNKNSGGEKIRPFALPVTPSPAGVRPGIRRARFRRPRRAAVPPATAWAACAAACAVCAFAAPGGPLRARAAGQRPSLGALSLSWCAAGPGRGVQTVTARLQTQDRACARGYLLSPSSSPAISAGNSYSGVSSLA